MTVLLLLVHIVLVRLITCELHHKHCSKEQLNHDWLEFRAIKERATV